MTWRNMVLAIALLAAGAVPARALSADDLEALAAGEPVVAVDSVGSIAAILHNVREASAAQAQ